MCSDRAVELAELVPQLHAGVFLPLLLRGGRRRLALAADHHPVVGRRLGRAATTANCAFLTRKATPLAVERRWT
eukprot:4283895-Alexandrium_andersonii.AAC.1